MGLTLGQLLIAADQTDQAHQVLGAARAAAVKIGQTGLAQQISDLLDPRPRKRADMIIQVEGTAPEDLEAAQRSVSVLAQSWGHEIADTPAQAPAAAGVNREDRVIDPVSVATLMLSLPSAALAVSDLADRIRKRHRATELIDCARELADQHVTACVIAHNEPLELRTMNPDQLLDLLADEDPAG